MPVCVDMLTNLNACSCTCLHKCEGEHEIVTGIHKYTLLFSFNFSTGWFESFSWSGVVFAVVASSVYEALTSQIDNLVLPLYTLAALPV